VSGGKRPPSGAVAGGHTRRTVIGCTIVAANYLPYARVLADGWRRAHPDAPFAVLCLDRDAGAEDRDDLSVVTPDALGLAPAALAQLRGIYSVAELTSAIKPQLLRALLDRGAGPVVFLDSDTDVHAGLADVAELAGRHGVALSPSLLAPPPLDGLGPSELELQRVGIYNSGFIAVGEPGRPFLDWWESRLRRDCLFYEEAGLHADQRWLDWVPVYFPSAILRDPAVNVAHWNLHERRLDHAATGFTIDGAPLRTFHFAGFDPEHPEQVTTYAWPSLRGLVEPSPALERLCRDYAGKLLAAGHRAQRGVPYRYGASAAGTPLGRRERAIYRELVLAAEARGVELPDPFDARRSAAFERLLGDPGPSGLLSAAALARLGEDARGPWHPAGALAAWRRRRWHPHPDAGDRTRMEYAPEPAAAAHG
jgi:hypothetical protein